MQAKSTRKPKLFSTVHREQSTVSPFVVGVFDVIFIENVFVFQVVTFAIEVLPCGTGFLRSRKPTLVMGLARLGAELTPTTLHVGGAGLEFGATFFCYGA
jgi:hypothetical protein